ncbi:MAG: DUF1566 domain-containing protein [Nitrospinales bacterium]
MSISGENTIKEKTGLPEEEFQRFVDNGDGTISDFETGLMWKKTDSYLEKDKWISWEEAKVYINNLRKEKFADYSDWRMPTRKEAMTIYDPDNPITATHGDTVYLPKVFPPGGGATIWTRTVHKEEVGLAMRFHFYNGDYKWHKKGLRSHGARAVRTFRK